MMFGLRSWLDLLRATWIAIRSTGSCLLIIVRGRKREGFYLNMPDIYLASLAIDDSQRGFNRVHRYTNLTCPHIGRAPRDNTNNTMLAFDVHNAVDNIVEGTITAVAYNEVIILFGSFGSQFHRVTTIFFDRDICFPASRR